MNLNTEGWKEFKIKDLFRLEPTKGKTTEDLEIGSDVPYIAAKHDVNGLMYMCKREGSEDYISKGNCIVFIQLGAGSAGYVNYLDEDFIGMNGKTCCGYIDGIMNKKIGIFLETILCQERLKYNFGRSWTGNRLKETLIALPIQRNKDGSPIIDTTHKYNPKGYIPDWKFMEDFINTLHYKPLTTKCRPKQKFKLNTSNWKDFLLNDLFNISIAKSQNIGSLDSGTIPFVGRTSDNNGIQGYVDSDIITDGNCITVSMVGTNVALWQHSSFVASQNIAVLRNDRLDTYNAMFICSIINKELSLKFSYGRTVTKDILKGMSIKLPINTTNNKPDWVFMEGYIKSLPYGDRI